MVATAAHNVNNSGVTLRKRKRNMKAPSSFNYNAVCLYRMVANDVAKKRNEENQRRQSKKALKSGRRAL